MTPMGRTVTATMLAVAAVVSPLAGADKPPPRQATITQVVIDLTREARQSWKSAGRWPRDRSDYAQERNVTVPNADLVRVLTRKLNPDPALESYVKWQLMSFYPDFTDATLEDYRRIVAVMPDVIAQPKPKPPPKPNERGGATFSSIRQIAFVSDLVPVPGTTGRRPVLSVVNSGIGLSVGDQPDPNDPKVIAESIQVTGERLKRVRAKTQAANVPIIKYRNALARELPDENGVGAVMMMQDLLDRVAAGDPTVDVATRRVLVSTEAIRDGRPIPDTVRRQLIAAVGQLASMRTKVVRFVGLGVAGVLQSDVIEVAVPGDDVRRMYENLTAVPAQPAP